MLGSGVVVPDLVDADALLASAQVREAQWPCGFGANIMCVLLVVSVVEEPSSAVHLDWSKKVCQQNVFK